MGPGRLARGNAQVMYWAVKILVRIVVKVKAAVVTNATGRAEEAVGLPARTLLACARLIFVTEPTRRYVIVSTVVVG